MTAVARENFVYKVVNGPTWTQAESNSIAIGGHLTSVQSQEENEFLAAYFVATQGDYQTNQGNHLWIGGTDSESEGNWRWIDGTPWTFTSWMQNQPDNALGGENYASFLHKGAGKWNDARDNYYQEQIPGSKIDGIAKIPLTSSITFFATPKEGAGAFTTSINLSAGNSSSGNLANGVTVYWKITGISAEDLASGALTGSGSISGGKLEIQHSLKQDSDTDERFEVTAYSDSAFTQKIGNTTSAAIEEGRSSNNGNNTNTTNNGNNNTVVTGNGNTVGNTTVINTTTNNIDNSTITNVTINNSSTSNNTTNNTNNITNNFSNVVGNITVDLSSLIQGASSKSDAISGSVKDDALGAGKGADKLTGAGGADQFVFNTRDTFGKKGADTITDFNPEEGDQLVLSPDALPGLKTDPSLQSVTSKKALKAAQKSESDLIYYQPFGQLFYDQNGSAKGFGSGGLFAVLSGAPVLAAEDLAVF